MKPIYAMLLNEIQFNVKAWYGVVSKKILSLEVIDEQLKKYFKSTQLNANLIFFIYRNRSMPLGWWMAK